MADIRKLQSGQAASGMQVGHSRDILAEIICIVQKYHLYTRLSIYLVDLVQSHSCRDRLDSLWIIVYLFIYFVYLFYLGLDNCLFIYTTIQLSDVKTEKPLLNLIKLNKILLLLHSFDRFYTKRNSVWCQINRKSVITIQIWFNLKLVSLRE